MSEAPSDRPTLLQMLEEVVDLSVGLGVLLLPSLILAVPGIILFVVLPAVLLLAAAAPVAIVAALVASPYMLVRSVRRRRRPRAVTEVRTA
jgi:Flp pilus assembly protein TadB